MILFSHPTGNANVRNAALALLEAELLHSFHTTYCHQKSILKSPLVPQSIRASLSRRTYPQALLSVLKTHSKKELTRHLLGKLPVPKNLRDKYNVDAVYQDLDRKCAAALRNGSKEISAVYCYEDGAKHSFEEARKRDLNRLYDLPIGYWRAARSIMSEEAERNPEWASTIPGNFDSEEKLQRKDDEIALANHIFVASSFTRKTLESCPTLNAEISVIPYGAPQSAQFDALESRSYSNQGRPLKALFVGSLGQRKGLSYLFEAIDKLSPQVELTVVGQMPARPCKPLNEALANCNYIPSAPHSEILSLMKTHDVFIFPSLFEGFGLVLVEAMSQGMPIITTSHTAGPDLIEDGKEGFIIPIASAEAIEEKLEQLTQSRALLAEMGQAALEKSKAIKWESYRDSLALACRKLLISIPTV